MATLSRDDVTAALLAHDPELREEMEADAGLLHLHLTALARHTQDAIAAGDLAVVRRDFMFADRILADADEYVRNAIHVSYLEHVRFRGEHAATSERLMSSRLREGHRAIHQHMDRLAATHAPARAGKEERHPGDRDLNRPG